MSNTCIRELADPVQIKECTEALITIKTSMSRISKILNLAGNQARLKILYLLFREGEMCPCDLSNVLEMTVPAVSQHLRKLKDGGVVSDKKIGKTVFYSVVKENSEIITPVLEGLLAQDQKLPIS